MNRLACALPLLLLLACSSEKLSDPSLALGAGGAGPSAVPSAPAAGAGSPEAPGPSFASYPAGPYGSVVGDTIDNLSFLGWHDPVAAGYDPSKLELVRLSDFYDPQGLRGTKLIAINVSAVWCAVCRSEYQDMLATSVYQTYSAKGVQLLGTLFEDNNYYPAQPSDLQLWGSTKYHKVAFPLVLDPGFKMGAYFTSDATPLNMLVDARSMKIVAATMGYSADYWSGVDTLLASL